MFTFFDEDFCEKVADALKEILVMERDLDRAKCCKVLNFDANGIKIEDNDKLRNTCFISHINFDHEIVEIYRRSQLSNDLLYRGHIGSEENENTILMRILFNLIDTLMESKKYSDNHLLKCVVQISEQLSLRRAIRQTLDFIEEENRKDKKADEADDDDTAYFGFRVEPNFIVEGSIKRITEEDDEQTLKHHRIKERKRLQKLNGWNRTTPKFRKKDNCKEKDKE